MNRSTSNTFKYSNKTYTIIATLYTNTGNKDTDVRISLDPVDIELLEYEGKLNDLLLKGKVVYTDKYARVDRMLNQHFGYFELIFALNKKETDDQVGMGEIDEKNRFIHNFIVTNVKVLNRSASIIQYEIDLMSMNWFKCIANLQYSNYNQGPQPILEILKNCISMQNIAIDDDSFGKVTAPVKVDYITQLNDNLFSVVKYLMHKLYYFSTKDSSIKFLVYDWFNDKFRLIDLKNKDTGVGTFSTVLSFFKTNNEALIQQEPTNIGAFNIAMPKTDVYETAFEKQMFDYDFNYDMFYTDYTTSDETINYFNNKIDNGNYELKYQKMFDVPNTDYIYYGSYWNNEYDVYNNTVQMLAENNSLILNITGDIKRQPGSFTIISLDRDLKNLTNDTKSEFEKMKQKYKAYEGVWMSSKVKNIICPKQQTFRQQLVMFRNFIPKIKAVE